MSQSVFFLTNKIAIITGGGSGLGFGIARAFIEAGAGQVIITGRRSHILKNACKQLGDQAAYIVHDITKGGTHEELARQIEEQYGKVDILVNNAGIHQKKDTLQVTDVDFNEIIQSNLNGLFSLTREISKVMAKKGSGSVINITSMAALYGIPNVAAYTASKSGVLGLTRALATDLSPLGIRVNAIAPGFIESPMLNNAFQSDTERSRRVLERTPLGLLGTPEDVGYAAVYLASDASRFITGVNLPVDGGNSIGF